ncbi:MAG: TIGR00304 family membrane protein [Methanosarcinales archaeon]
MNLIIVGIILILIGFLLIWSEILKLIFKRDTCIIEPERTEMSEGGMRELKGGGVVMIGPIPIIFASDKKYAIILAIIAIILMLMVALLSAGVLYNVSHSR